MRDNPFAEFPERPGDVGEWEDLLVRFELAPRAVRLALEAAPNGIELPDPRLDAVAAELHRLGEREVEAWRWMQALRDGAPLGGWANDDALPPLSAATLREGLERFSSHRARNFAWVQRRGLDVWEWRAEHPGFGVVTPFRLIAFLVRNDGRQLAAIRDAFRAAQPC